jgi:hypothetical protein
MKLPLPEAAPVRFGADTDQLIAVPATLFGFCIVYEAVPPLQMLLLGGKINSVGIGFTVIVAVWLGLVQPLALATMV